MSDIIVPRKPPQVNNELLQARINERWTNQCQGLYESDKTPYNLLWEAMHHDNPGYVRVLTLVALVKIAQGQGHTL